MFAALGFGCLAYLSVIWFMGHSIGTRPLLLLGVLLVLVGAQLVSVGLLGEMISSSQVGGRPHYEIRYEQPPGALSPPASDVANTVRRASV
jgi:hypothetical protein